MAVVTDALVAAKDEAVRGELQTEIVQAVADLRKDMLRMT